MNRPTWVMKAPEPISLEQFKRRASDSSRTFPQLLEDSQAAYGGILEKYRAGEISREENRRLIAQVDRIVNKAVRKEKELAIRSRSTR